MTPTRKSYTSTAPTSFLTSGCQFFIILTEDSLEQTEVVGVGVLASESEEVFQWVFEVLKAKNTAWRNVKVVMGDKDMKER